MPIPNIEPQNNYMLVEFFTIENPSLSGNIILDPNAAKFVMPSSRCKVLKVPNQDYIKYVGETVYISTDKGIDVGSDNIKVRTYKVEDQDKTISEFKEDSKIYKLLPIATVVGIEIQE